MTELVEPTPTEIRERIVKAESPWREFFSYLLISGSRVSEAVAEEQPGDLAETPKHHPSRNYGVYLTMSVVPHELDEAAMFTVRTAKRGGMERAVAVPLHHDPLTKGVVDLWDKTGENPWQWNRGQALYQAHKIFSGLGYIVEDQKKGDVKTPKHLKPCGNHAMRHFRTQELMLKYDFSDRDLMQFFGWTARNIGINPMIVRYAALKWQNYYPKLVR
jgi:hypothetical protein